MKKINICSFIIVLALFMLIGCGVKKIKMPFNDSDAKTMQYTEVIEQLSNAGFSNVESSSTPTNKENQDGLVKKVTIYVTQRFPTDFFSKGSSYAYDTRIEVVYYTYEAPIAEEQNSQASESQEASTEVSSEEPADSNESSKSFEPEPLNVSEDEYLKIVEETIDGCIGNNETYGAVTLKDGVLTIPVTMGETYGENGTLPIEDVAESLISSITDAILTLDDSYWDSVIVDFGSIGIFTGMKQDIISSEYGRYFDNPFLDKNKDLYTSYDPISDTDKLYYYSMCQVACNKYITGATYPSKDYYVRHYDSNGAFAVYTNQLELKNNDYKQELYVVFTPVGGFNDSDAYITIHYLRIGNNILYDDNYCSDN